MASLLERCTSARSTLMMYHLRLLVWYSRREPPHTRAEGAGFVSSGIRPLLYLGRKRVVLARLGASRRVKNFKTPETLREDIWPHALNDGLLQDFKECCCVAQAPWTHKKLTPAACGREFFEF